MSDKQEIFDEYLKNFHLKDQGKEEFLEFIMNNQENMNWLILRCDGDYMLNEIHDKDILNELIKHSEGAISHIEITNITSLRILHRNNITVESENMSRNIECVCYHLKKTSYKDLCRIISNFSYENTDKTTICLVKQIIQDLVDEKYEPEFINNVIVDILFGTIDCELEQDEKDEILRVIYPYVTDYTRVFKGGNEITYGNFIDVFCNYPEILKHIFSKCKRIKKKGFLKGGSNPLFYVTNIESIKILVDKGYDINERYYETSGIEDPLCNFYRQATYEEVNLELMKAFIENGYNINFTDINGSNLLFERYQTIGKLLIECGIDVNCRNNFGYNYIQWNNLSYGKKKNLIDNRRLTNIDKQLFVKDLTKKQYRRLINQGANEHINVKINGKSTSFINFHRGNKNLKNVYNSNNNLFYENSNDNFFIKNSNHISSNNRKYNEDQLNSIAYSLRKRVRTLRRFTKDSSYDLLKRLILYKDVELECLRLTHDMNYETYVFNGRKYRKCNFDKALIIHRNNDLIIEYLLKTLMLNPNHVENNKTILDYKVSDRVRQLCLEHGFVVKEKIIVKQNITVKQRIVKEKKIVEKQNNLCIIC